MSTRRSSEPLKPISSLKIQELAWAAGFIDGEGCFSTDSTTLNLRAYNTYKPAILRLQEMFGGNVNTRSRPKESYKQMWIWSVGTLQAKPVIEAILPFLTVKVHQAETALELIDALRRSAGPKRDPAIVEKREILREKIRNLNQHLPTS